MAQMNPKVDEFLNKATKWREEMAKLRKICLDAGLTEELKWGRPGYTLNNSNVVIIQGFKEYFALLFIKGSLLKDPKGILFAPGENTQAGRQIRFTSLREIDDMKPTLRAYIDEAIEIEKTGMKVEKKQTSDYPVPEEFQAKLDENPALKTAFETLTPGRQRAYLLYFAQPKQSKTRESRIEKNVPNILDGKGLNDQ